MKNKYFMLVFATVTAMLLGLAYAWSLFVEPIEQSMGWVRAQTSMIFTLSMICFFGGACIAGFLNFRFSLKQIALSSAIAFLIVFTASANTKELWQIYLAYGIIGGLTTGISYFAIMNTVNKWFPDKLGMSSGCMMMGFALGSFLLGSVVSFAIENVGWRMVFHGMAVLFALQMVIVAFAIIAPSQKEAKPESTIFLPKALREWPPSKMLRNKSFYIYFVWSILIIAIGVTIIGNAAVISSSIGGSTYMAILCTGAVSLGNGICRIAFGILYDKIGRKFTLRLVCIVAVVGSLFLETALIFKIQGLLLTSFLFVGASYGGIAPCHSVIIKDYFGYQFYSKNFGILNMNGVVASVVGSLLVGSLQSYSRSYVLSCLLLPVYACLAFLLLFYLPAPENIERESL